MNLFSKLMSKKNEFNKQISNLGIIKAMLFSGIYFLYYIYKYFILNKINNLHSNLLKIKLFNNKQFYISKKDKGLSLDLYLAKIREPIVTKKIIKLLSKEKNNTFLDIGANLGYYTIILSDYFKKIVCLEPNKKAIEVLKKNVEVNKLDKKTTVLEGAVHYSKKNLYMIEKDEINLSKVSEEKGDYLLKTYTLKTLFSKFKPTFIKMDVEGFEYALFTDEIIEEKKHFPKYIFIEIHLNLGNYSMNKRILKIFEKLGYKMRYAIWEMKGPHYFSYKYKIWAILSNIIKKIVAGKKDYILAENKSISEFIRHNKEVVNGKLGAIEFIFEKVR